MTFFAHPQALVETSEIGKGTRIWAFAHVLPGAVIGEDCNICDHVFVENEVRVGDRVTVKCGVQLWNGVILEDDVFVGPNATFTNDPFPRSKKRPTSWRPTLVKQGASIGANATVLPGITIGRNAMVAAGAVVTHDVPPDAIVAGNPSAIHGYAAAPPHVEDRGLALSETTPMPSSVRGVTLYRLPRHEDLRGSALVGELPRDLPFAPKRFFVVSDVPTREVRGERAQRKTEQFLVCLRGQCWLLVDDGHHRLEMPLDQPTIGVHVRAGVWASQYRFSSDAMLLVLASEPYDAADYIREYKEFITLTTAGSGASTPTSRKAESRVCDEPLTPGDPP